MNAATLDRWAPRALAVLRIVTGLLFLQHGLMKLFAFPAAMPMPLNTVLIAAAVLEVVGAPLIVLGLLTRPVAFILSGEMAIAYWIGHAPQGFWPVLNGGEPAIFFCFVFLYLAFAGPGAWNLASKLNGLASRALPAAAR